MRADLRIDDDGVLLSRRRPLSTSPAALCGKCFFVNLCGLCIGLDGKFAVLLHLRHAFNVTNFTTFLPRFTARVTVTVTLQVGLLMYIIYSYLKSGPFTSETT